MDSIHGLMPWDHQLFSIIDTPEFQRLRGIKQLGVAYLCFPGATHTRLSHSLGVGHLAGQVFDRVVTPDLDLRDIDRLLFQAAGLLHDIGHGPFSHVFENEVMPALIGNHAWNHEEQGLRLIDKLIDDNHIDLFDSSQVKQLKGMIMGQVPSEHKFLQQIISNQDSGIDVDRMDYFQRDAQVVGLSHGFNPNLILTYMHIVDSEICFDGRKVYDIFQFFATRYSLHSRLYQHSVSKAIEFMVRDALIAVTPTINLVGMVEDLDLYCNLTDAILDVIRLTPGISEAKKLLDRISRRQLYKMVQVSETPIEIKSGQILQKVVFNHGMGPNNPLDTINFYHPHAAGTPRWKPSYGTLCLPSKFETVIYRAFSTT